MTRFFLGVDGGATKTQAAIVNERGRLLGVGSGGSSNFGDVGQAQAQVNVGQAAAAARHMAGVDASPLPGLKASEVSVAFLGVAGVVSDADRAIGHGIAQALALAASGRVGVDHDCRVALAGG